MILRRLFILFQINKAAYKMATFFIFDGRLIVISHPQTNGDLDIMIKVKIIGCGLYEKGRCYV